MKKNNPAKAERKGIDWLIVLVPLLIVVSMSILFILRPEQSNEVIAQIRHVLGDSCGVYYIIIGLGTFIFSIVVACSKYGNIILGDQNEKPKYSFFAWGL